jgi:hypothetical protein
LAKDVLLQALIKLVIEKAEESQTVKAAALAAFTDNAADKFFKTFNEETFDALKPKIAALLDGYKAKSDEVQIKLLDAFLQKLKYTENTLQRLDSAVFSLKADKPSPITLVDLSDGQRQITQKLNTDFEAIKEQLQKHSSQKSKDNIGQALADLTKAVSNLQANKSSQITHADLSTLDQKLVLFMEKINTDLGAFKAHLYEHYSIPSTGIMPNNTCPATSINPTDESAQNTDSTSEQSEKSAEWGNDKLSESNANPISREKSLCEAQKTKPLSRNLLAIFHEAMPKFGFTG